MKWIYVIPILFYVLPAAFMLAFTATAGAWVRRRAWHRLLEEERALEGRHATGLRRPPMPERIAEARLVLGNSTVSPGYIGRWAAGWKSWFGGELRGLTDATDRARREALVRMKQAFPDADAYYNCRVETSFLTDPRGGGILCVEVSAAATGVRYDS